MSNKFRIEVRFTGMPVTEAQAMLEEVNAGRDISVDGFWHVVGDEYANQAIIDGVLTWRQDSLSASISNLKVTEYSGKLVSPLIDKGDLRDVAMMMNKLYSFGAVVMSTNAVKIHPLREISDTKRYGIIKRLARQNKLLYTVLFFPRLMAPLCLPARSYEKDEALAAAIFHSYREIVDGICQSDDGSKLVDGVVTDLLAPNTRPERDEGKYLTRFDRDSSPDSDDYDD